MPETNEFENETQEETQEETTVEETTTEEATETEVDERDAKIEDLEKQLEEANKAPKPKKRDKYIKPKANEKKEGLDYGEKAFLKASGIEGDEQIEEVQTWLDRGMTLEEITSDEVIGKKLETIKQNKINADATPKAGNRAGKSASNTTDYWIKKGELPPDTAENRKLRTDIVNEKTKRASVQDEFGG